MSNKSKWAYLAGLLDSQLGWLTPMWVTITCGRPLAKWLMLHFGGSFRANSRESRWELTITEKFLLGVLPYLIIKKQDAQIILDHVRQKSPETNTPDGPRPKIESELRGDMESAPAVM